MVVWCGSEWVKLVGLRGCMVRVGEACGITWLYSAGGKWVKLVGYMVVWCVGERVKRWGLLGCMVR